MDVTTSVTVGLSVVVGALVGALLFAWRLRLKSNEKLHMPEKWPLNARGLVSAEEHEVWRWLRSTFHDHAVMIKIPVPRFTIPQDKEKGKRDSERWLEVLNGVYATFSVCTLEGKVVGCVDVPGKRGLSKGNRELKETLLSDCGIGYTVVRGTRLPTGDAMRAAFLGEVPPEPEEQLSTRGGDSNFHADLNSFTKDKMKAAKEAALKELNKNVDETAKPTNRVPEAGFNAEGTGAWKINKPNKDAAQWEDSFAHSSDGRPGRPK